MMATLPNPSRRDFYREALASSFRHSGLLSAQTGRRAEQIVETPEFQALLNDARASSLDLARRVGDMAVVYLSGAAAPGPWWRELLAYERAHFLQAVTAEQRLVTYFPRRGPAATTVNFTWDIPELLLRIGAGSGCADVSRRSFTLLFSRAVDGRIRAVELDKPTSAVFRMTNGMRKKEQIAEAAALPLDQTDDILHALAEIGAVEKV